MERFSTLREKQVINICDGKCIGHVFDLVLDCHCGAVCALVVPGCSRLRSYLFGGGEDVVIPWNKVVKIGEDVILVELDHHTPMR
ncbi:MAG: YlmC/YmxH family sporulation protein [Clostridiales bacterium]|nr:YlmC/YmxH family sporulation protein [Clostridiales bacterium]